MKISELIKLLESRKKQFGNIDVVDDLGYITNDVIYNEVDFKQFLHKERIV